VALTWFDSTEAIRTTSAAAEYARVVSDDAVFLAPGAILSILTREHVIVA